MAARQGEAGCERGRDKNGYEEAKAIIACWSERSEASVRMGISPVEPRLDVESRAGVLIVALLQILI